MLETQLDLEVRAQPLTGPRLVEDYRAGTPAIRSFFGGNPFSLASFVRKAEEVDARFDAGRRASMAEAIAPSSEGAARRLREVVERGGFFVTTGQQAGAFGGPLFTIYKALSAIRLAEALERRLGRPVAPLFWVASEDHDWEEVNHAVVPDSEHRLHRIELPADGATAPVSMARRRIGPTLEATLQELEQVLPSTPYARAVLDQIRGAYGNGGSVATGFQRLLCEWFAPQDLLVTDAAHPRLKRLSAGVLLREAAQPDASARAVAAQTARLEAAGYHAQVPVLPGFANLFFEGSAGRERLAREGDTWVAREAGREWSTKSLIAAIEAQPGSFSPNVLLRPVVESVVFPTLAYVAGPAEISYHAQLGCLFRIHGARMPVVVPRASAILLEPRVRRALGKLGLSPAELNVPPHELAQRIARDALPEDVDRGLAMLRLAIGAGFDDLGGKATRIDPTLAGPIRSARHGALREVERAEKKILRQLKERNAILLQQAETARSSLFPHGQPQERVLNVVGYLARYGPDFVAMLARSIAAPPLDEEDWGGDGCDGT